MHIIYKDFFYYLWIHEIVFACTLICCEAGKYKEVDGEVKKFKEVKRAFGVHGRWDVVVEIEVSDLKELGDIVLKLHGLPRVRATETLVGFQEV